MTKDQILEGYLNIVYYGDRAYGVEAASRSTTSTGANNLNLTEAALLAGSVQNPGTTDPVNNPERGHGPAQRRPRPDARARPHHRQGGDRRQGGHSSKQMLKVTSAPTACQASRATRTSATTSSSGSSSTRRWSRPSARRSTSAGQDLRRRPDHPDDDRPRHARRPARGAHRDVPEGNTSEPRCRRPPPEPGTGKMVANTKDTQLARTSARPSSTGRRHQVRRLRAASSSGRRRRRSRSSPPWRRACRSTRRSTPAGRRAQASLHAEDQRRPARPSESRRAPAVERPQRRDRRRPDDDHPGEATPVDQHRVHRARRPGRGLQRPRPRPGWACTGPTATRSPRSPSGIILGTQEVSPMTVASAYGSLANERRSTARRSRSIDHAPTARSCRSQARARSASRSSTPDVAGGASIMTSVLTGTARVRRAPWARRPSRPARRERRRRTTRPGSSATPRS